jgi:serine protease Do
LQIANWQLQVEGGGEKRSTSAPSGVAGGALPAQTAGNPKFQISNFKFQFAILLVVLLLAPSAFASIADAIAQAEPRMVKITGAGGVRGMEGYQSGMLISPQGHILTAYTYALDTDFITVVLADGRKFDAKLLGAEPRLEVAVLKIEAAGLPCFRLAQAVKAEAGTGVLAVSNLFNVATGSEPASVQKGTIAVVTQLEARRGVFETPYHGPVYVLDVTTNNPGAAGGALVTRDGRLVGMLGKELRNALNNTWLNYAVPIGELRKPVEAIQAGKYVAQREADANRKPPRPLDLAALGIMLVPDVLERTPAFVDRVFPGSPAEKAGIRPDDLILLLRAKVAPGEKLITSCKALVAEMQLVDYEDEITLTVLRSPGTLLEFPLRSSGPPPKNATP